jgi:hypothetical protein
MKWFIVLGKTEPVTTEKNVLKKVLFSTTNESVLESQEVADE